MNMKKCFLLFLLIAALLCGCAAHQPPAQIAATTLPVYEFTARLCDGTPLTVTQLVTEPVSCLHDYSLNVRQARAAEAAELIVITGRLYGRFALRQVRHRQFRRNRPD